MGEQKHRVAIIGCGRMGQEFATAYAAFPDTEIVAIAEVNPERRKAVGERFGVGALYPDADSLLKDIVPDIAAVVTPTKYMKDAVIACAQAGVKGVSTDKPMAARLADADAMVDTCASLGVVFAGGNLACAGNDVQEAARWMREGRFGDLVGAIVSGWADRLSGGGVQWISTLRLFLDCEVREVIAWGAPPEALETDDDYLIANGIFKMTNGFEVPVYAQDVSGGKRLGIDVWSKDSLIRWVWGTPEIYRGFDDTGARIQIDPGYTPWEWRQFNYLTGSIRSLIAAVETGSRLAISGHDLRQALEVAIATKLSAKLGSVPVKLPLEDRSLTMYPEAYRWLGGDQVGNPQTAEEAGKSWEGYDYRL